MLTIEKLGVNSIHGAYGHGAYKYIQIHTYTEMKVEIRKWYGDKQKTWGNWYHEWTRSRSVVFTNTCELISLDIYEGTVWEEKWNEWQTIDFIYDYFPIRGESYFYCFF